MRKRRQTLAVMLVIFVIRCAAQDVVLTSTSSTYPNQRGQWSEAQGEAWQKKYGPIIGVNCPYPPCGAISQEQSIALAASLGYNSIRWWPGGGTNADAYIQAVEQWAGWAAKYGMTVSPVFGFSQTYYAQSNKTMALKNLEAQVRKVIRHFRGDDRIILWDIWNEPVMSGAEECEEVMSWIEKMILWCQQEGCTQPITASIIWDSGVTANTTTNALRTRREKTEALMDLHNYHSYSAQDGFNQDTPTMVARIRKMDQRPIVCTECMTRPNGSTYSRTLYDFARYHINFYTWGLYACDANWEVKWSRSTFYNWEPMFHNLLYADGEPIDEHDLPLIAGFRFTDTNEDPGAEWTERWAPRRAWRWMSRPKAAGVVCADISRATAAILTHKNDKSVNTVAVRISYSEYNSNSSSLYSKFNSLLTTAENAGFTVIPILLTSDQQSVNAASLANYVYNFILKYYTDRRIQAWCVYEQTKQSDATKLATLLPAIFHKARYAFPNQPMFVTPLADENAVPDEEADDVCNLMWRLSDICSINGDASAEWLARLDAAYHRPIYSLTSSTVSACHSTQATLATQGEPARWPAWRAWQWMSGVERSGISYSSLAVAQKALAAFEEKGSTPYNSLCLPLDYRNWLSNKTTFYKGVDSLLNMAGRLGMTVVPQLMSDAYARMPIASLTEYVQDVVGHYSQEPRVLAWDIYNKPCATSADATKASELLDVLFATARGQHPIQPLYATPVVTTNNFEAGFDPVASLVHGVHGGWGRLSYGKGNVTLCYNIWCMSDVVAYSSSQTSAQLGWLNSVACKFGRPLFCADWKPATSEEPSKAMDIFEDMHINWYVNGTLDESLVRDFHYIPVSTAH